MVGVECARWGQTPEDLRRASVEAPHPRSRERFQALYLIASGRFNATACAAHIGRQDETVPGWVHRYNARGPDAVAYRRPLRPGDEPEGQEWDRVTISRPGTSAMQPA